MVIAHRALPSAHKVGFKGLFNVNYRSTFCPLLGLGVSRRSSNEKFNHAVVNSSVSALSMQAPPQTPTALTPQTSTRGQGTMDAVAGSSSGVVLSETQLGNMALRAKQQRFKAEQDRQLLQVLALPYLRNARSELI